MNEERTEGHDDSSLEEQASSSPLSPEDLAKKKAVLERARADHAIKGEPTSGMPGQAEHRRAEDVVPPPGGQTDQTR
jgi:hypothetical protein